MKKFFVTLAVVTLVFGFTGITNVYATPINITIPDLVSSGGNLWYGPQEDQEVEPGCLTGQEWDLEAFFFDDSDDSLYMAGGYNFVSGEGNWLAGDIFIDIDGDAQYGPGNDGTGVGNTVVSSIPFGYDFVLDMDWENMIFDPNDPLDPNDDEWVGTYNIVDIRGGADVRTTYFGINQESNPWRYESGGEIIGDPTEFGVFQVSEDEILAETGVELFGGVGPDALHNVVGVNLDWLFTMGYSSFTVHNTMQCGNDNLMGHYDPIPEPGTLLLLGAGLIGLIGLGRKFGK